MLDEMLESRLGRDVVITCPPPAADGLARAIRARGNCPLDVDGEFVFELTGSDLAESWASASELPVPSLGAMTRDLGNRLTGAETGAALDAKMADAAAFFLLALRHNNLTPERALKGCRVTWHAETMCDEVVCLA